MAVLKPFEDSTGIKVQYESTRDEDAILRTRVAAGNAPDLAAAPSPALLTQFAQQGKVKALNDAWIAVEGLWRGLKRPLKHSPQTQRGS